MSKPLDRLTLLETFVRIADGGSLSAAARDLGLSQPSVSRQLAELEARLKAQLVRRTTHSLSLTTAGVELLADARQLLDSWEALEEKHLADETQVRGKLTIVAPIALGQTHLARMAWRFQQTHPQVVLSWQLADHAIRFIETGCDCWIKVGPIGDDTLVVRTLGSVERLVVASPRFVEAHGRSRTPQALEKLPWLALEPFESNRIPLQHRNGKTLASTTPVRMSTNNIFALREAALMGLGLTILPRWFINTELQDGRLIDVLPQWRAPTLSIQVAYLPGRYQPRRLRVFLDTLQAAIPAIPGIGNNAVG